MNWDAIGSLADWAAAAGTTLAFVAAYRLLRVERTRDREQQRALERHQAERVAVWPSEVRSDFTDPKSSPVWGAAVCNGSDLPVYQVHIEFSGINEPSASAVIMEVVPPGDWLLSGRELYRRPESSGHGPGVRDLSRREFTVSVRFTDAATRKWHRTAQGDLVRIDL